jgi:hypothetical protein
VPAKVSAAGADGCCVTEESRVDRWQARPIIALSLRLVIVAVPLAVGYVATLICLRLLRSQLETSKWWLVPVVGVSIVTCLALERVTRRLLPLAALLKLSMLFPDRAPSRFKIARRAMSNERIANGSPGTATADAGSAAERALALITALTAHDRRTRGHSERVRLFADLLGEQLRLPREARDKLRWSSLLHDIGKLQVAADILNKPTKLDTKEWDAIVGHPAAGEQLLGPLIAWLGEWGGAVRQHHERFDGAGYPDGVAGTTICRAARMVSIADSFEVMTAARTYKKPMATIAARAELTRCAGTQFDPTYVRAFLAISLPRLLWTMGPGSLLMNLPVLRTLADTANKGVVATAQSGALSASAAAVIAGAAVTAAGPVAHQAQPVTHVGAAPRHTTTIPATPAPRLTPAPPKRPKAKPRVTPAIVIPQPTTPGSAPPVSPPQSPAPPQLPAPPPPLPVAPPVVNTADVAFAWVPFPVIASTEASVGFTANSTTVAVLCSLDDAPQTVCAGSSVTYANLADGPHLIALTGMDEHGQPGATISTAFTVDTLAATVAWTATPPAQVASGDVTLGFVANDPSAVAWCSLDGAAPAVCVSPYNLAALADGPHTVNVYTVDAVGNEGPAIETTFTVDTTRPIVAITSAPAAVLTTSTATLDYTVDDPSATVWCALDGAVATTCTSPITYSALSDGPHDVAVYAVDAVGNVGTAEHSSFTVDTSAPSVTFTSAPAAIVPSHSVSIGFAVDDPDATAWCALDGGAAAPCASPVTYEALPDGPHSVSVFAIDAAGNIGSTIQTSFTVNATAPTVTLNSVPAAVSNVASASVAFSVDDPNATAFCSLDGNTPTVCTSPVTYSGLSDGEHVVDIYATSLANQQSATASTSFAIDTDGPTVTITHAPASHSTTADANLTFTVDDPSAGTWCSFDGAAAIACTSPVDLGALGDGQHTVAVHATDPAGNTSAVVQAGFTLDNTAPTATFTTTPGASPSRTATADFTTNDPSATTWCSLDANAAQICTNSVTYTGLSDGTHTINVYAIDQAGNQGATISTSFTVSAAAPTLVTTPPAKSSTKDVTFRWLSEPGLTYQYSYNGINWATTTTLTTYTAKLPPGFYTFRLRGIDSHFAPTGVTSFTFRIT